MKKNLELKSDHREALAEFLNSADMVKFAKHMPSVDQATRHLLLARQFVLETKPVSDPDVT